MRSMTRPPAFPSQAMVVLYTQACVQSSSGQPLPEIAEIGYPCLRTATRFHKQLKKLQILVQGMIVIRPFFAAKNPLDLMMQCARHTTTSGVTDEQGNFPCCGLIIWMVHNVFGEGSHENTFAE